MRGYFGQLWRQTSVRHGERALSGQPTVPLEVEKGAWAGVGEMETGADQGRDVYQVGVFGELIAEEPAKRQEGEARLGSQQPFPRSEPREHAPHLNSSPRVSAETPSFSAAAEWVTREEIAEKQAPHPNSPRAQRPLSLKRGEDVILTEDAGDAAPSFSARRPVLEKEHIIEKNNMTADGPDSIDARRRAISPELSQFGGDSAPAWQTAMQQVREWVAAPPASNQATEKQQPSKTNEQVEPIFAQPAAERVVYRESSTQTPHLQAKSQEFHLSIGTISLTIEEPRPERQPISPPVAQPSSKPENRRSRLSRHYLRIT